MCNGIKRENSFSSSFLFSDLNLSYTKKTWSKKLDKLGNKFKSLGVDNSRNICHKRLVNFEGQS